MVRCFESVHPYIRHFLLVADQGRLAWTVHASTQVSPDGIYVGRLYGLGVTSMVTMVKMFVPSTSPEAGMIWPHSVLYVSPLTTFTAPCLQPPP